MNAPSQYFQPPQPTTTNAGYNYSDPAAEDSLAQQAWKWRPDGCQNEPPVSTMTRAALRLIDRVTGEDYSADELTDILQESTYDGTPVNYVAATAATATLTIDTGTLALAAVTGGDIPLEVVTVDPDGPDGELTVVEVAGTVTVTLATDSESVITTTLTELKTALNTSTQVAAGAIANGTTLVTAGTTTLTEGTDAILGTPGKLGRTAINSEGNKWTATKDDPTTTQDGWVADTASTTTAGILDLLKGAVANPDKIGTEFLPDVLEVESIIIPTLTDADIGPVDSLALVNGALTIQDNSTPGGIPVVDRHARGSIALDFSALPKAGGALPMFILPIKQGELVTGTKIIATGTIFLKIQGAITKLICGYATPANAHSVFDDESKGWAGSNIHPIIENPSAIPPVPLTPATLPLVRLSGRFIVTIADDGLGHIWFDGLDTKAVSEHSIYTIGAGDPVAMGAELTPTLTTSEVPEANPDTVSFMLQLSQEGTGNMTSLTCDGFYDLMITSIIPA